MSSSVPQLLDVYDVARSLRVSPYTVRRWATLGKLQRIRLGGRILFHPDDISRFIERSRRASRDKNAEL